MKNTTAVDVFLGHPLVDATEKHFLQRLRRDLYQRGTVATVLANLQVGSDFRQLDFVIVGEHRAIVCELKGYSDPLVARANGRWHRIVAGSRIATDGNPYRQVHDCGYALSDAMRSYARAAQAPGPTKDKFIKHFDLVVCIYPSIADGSDIEPHRWVHAIGYTELLDRLEQPGPRPPWDDEQWDAFIRHLSLYRDEEDSDAARALRIETAAADEYASRFVHARQADVSAIVPTSVLIDKRPADRPDLLAVLDDGQDVLLCGASGHGKTLWAHATTVDMARSGHVPVWLDAKAYEGDFATFLARAVAPYTTLAAAQLLKAARTAGRPCCVIVDGLNECPEPLRSSLIAGVQTLRVRSAALSALVTTQETAEPPAGLSPRIIELRPLDDAERRAVLRLHDAEGLAESLDGFQTPLDLTLAAICAGEQPQPMTPTEIVDSYVDRVTGTESTRAILRSIAWRMHEEVRLSLRAPDLVRSVRRELGVNAAELQAALSCRLLNSAHGRISFQHERFANFLAADALIERCDNGESCAVLLNQPRAKAIAHDAIALESDEARLGEILASIDDDDLLVHAINGLLGELPQRTAHAVVRDSLHIASALMTSDGIKFEAGADHPLQDAWHVPWTIAPNTSAQLTAAGRCIRRGMFIDEIAHLVEQTDSLCKTIGPGRTFATTYAIGLPATRGAILPASIVARACTHEGYAHRDVGIDIPRGFYEHAATPGLGTLYFTASLLRPLPEGAGTLAAEVVRACLDAPAYHLRLEALQLLYDCGAQLEGAEHDEVLAAVTAVETNNIFLSSAVVEALARLGEIEPRCTVEDLAAELRELLDRPDDPLAWRQASGAVSSQWEDQSIIGPYYEAMNSLEPEERDVVLSMALRSCDPDDMNAGWILDEIDRLDEPRLRSAVVDFVSRLNPHDWHSHQSGTASTLLALRLLARARVPRPPSRATAEAAAWEDFLQFVDALMRAPDDPAADLSAGEQSRQRLLSDHRPVLADLLFHVRSARVMINEIDFEAQIVPALGAELSGVLTWSLEHIDQLRSPYRFPWGDDRARHIVQLLGQVGDARAAGVLRRYADDRALGRAAVEAVRAIESTR